MPNPPKLCPTCRAPIPADAPAGLCPACLLLGAAAPTEPAPGALASAPSMGQVVAAFPELEIVELFAHGGMGVIYKARQPRLDRLVALKILPPKLARQPGFTERFTREARALARLNHPHIVSVYDFGERDGLCFLIMEFVNGVNLRQAMRSGVTPEQALALVPGICEALQFAHDHGVLHRDIKPENILLDVKGTPKLADFGIAKLAEEKAENALTLSGDALGTAAYMAPEQIEKPASVDHRADIYSLGVVLYEMLTGELPLGRFAAPSSKAKVTTGVDDVVFRALEKERELRQQSATEMKTQVERATSAGNVPPAPVAAARRGEGRALAIAGVLMNIAPIVLLALLAWPSWRIDALARGGADLPASLLTASPEVLMRYLLPLAITASVAFGLTAVALWVRRYRAPWFFRWLISYGIVTAPAGIGLVILVYCWRHRQEFRAEPEDAEDAGPVKGLDLPATLFLLLALTCAVLIPFAAVNPHFGEKLPPLLLSILAAVFGAMFAVSPRGPQLRDASPREVGPFPWQLPVIAGAMAIPFAIVLAFYGGRWARGVGFGSAFGILAAVLLPVLVALYAALIVSAFRGMVRAGVPRWFSASLAVPLSLLLPGAILWSSTFVAVGNVSPFATHGASGSYDQAPVTVSIRATAGPAIARWAQGSVELVAVAKHGASETQAWSTDGRRAKEGPFITTANRVAPEPDERAYDFIFRARDLPPGASSPTWSVDQSRSSSTGGIPALLQASGKPLAGYHVVASTFPQELTTANIKAGLAFEPWHTLSTNRPNNMISSGVWHEGVNWQINHGTADQTINGGIVVTVSYAQHPSWEARLVAVTNDGTELPFSQLSRLGMQSEWRFPKLPLDTVRAFRFQVRPIRWVEFRNIALRPDY